MSTTKINDQVAWGRVWQIGCYSVLLCLGLGLVSKVWGVPLPKDLVVELILQI